MVKGVKDACPWNYKDDISCSKAKHCDAPCPELVESHPELGTLFRFTREVARIQSNLSNKFGVMALATLLLVALYAVAPGEPGALKAFLLGQSFPLVLALVVVLALAIRFSFGKLMGISNSAVLRVAIRIMRELSKREGRRKRA